jgi:hypothetical protein
MGSKTIGYSGQVTLVSPSGDKKTIYLPGRCRAWWNKQIVSGQGGDEKKFYHLLSAGWKVFFGQVGPNNKVCEEEKKNTDVVIGTTKSGNLSHGGDHASAEVANSPNAAAQGCQVRGNRGGRKERQPKQKKSKRIQVQRARQVGSGAVYAPQPLRVKPGVLESAKESGELLAQLVGRSDQKIKRGVTVKTEKFLVALEIGDDPLPALEWPEERPKLKVLVTPDCSGSTQGWSGLGQAWALCLSQLPETDVIYVTNFNGSIWETISEAESLKLIQSVDVVLYLGDGDGYSLCERYASLGATVLAMDCHCASVAKPRVKAKQIGQGRLYWVDRVSAKEPATWTQAIRLCLGS